MIKEVEEYIRKYHMIEEQDTIVAGVSGGADSVCLLLQLWEYRKKIDFKIVVVHMNHLIRGDAAKDAEYVRKLCEEREIPFYLFEEDIHDRADKFGISVEEAGRQARYEAFEKIRRPYGTKGKIAVAHNQNDNAETMLFHLFRGSGVHGLAGILPLRDQIIRPLLCISRAEIEKYLSFHNIKWCIDSTNSENTYTRNKIRNVLLPYAENEICHNAAKHVAFSAVTMSHLLEYLQEETSAAYKEVVTENQNEIVLQLEILRQYKRLIQEQIILSVFEKITPAKKDITATHVADVLSLLEKEGYHTISLPYRLEAVKNYQELCIRKKKQSLRDSFFKEVTPPQILLLQDGKSAHFTLIPHKKDENIVEKTYTKWFDYDKILHCLVLRNRLTGDYLTINSMLQHKTLKEYMIEEKIPKEDREKLLVLADGQHIIWIIGKRISEAYKVTDKTERILCVEIKEDGSDKAR